MIFTESRCSQFWKRDSCFSVKESEIFAVTLSRKMYFASVGFWLGLSLIPNGRCHTNMKKSGFNAPWKKIMNCLVFFCYQNLTPLTLCNAHNHTPAKFERLFISSEKEEIEKHEVAVGSSKVATKHTKSYLLPVAGGDDISLRISF